MAMSVLLFLLKWLELQLLIISYAFEVYAGSIALIFTLLGIWIAHKIRPLDFKSTSKPTPVVSQITINTDAAEQLNISKREHEVLEFIAKGYSNSEIAAHLFISTHTVKSHTARLFEKLEVRRRTQAVEKAKQSGLLQRTHSKV